MIRILTIYGATENVHLTKDVGMIPFILHKHYGYDATIACYENGAYPYLKTEVKGLKQQFIKKYFKSHTLNYICFLLFNFRKFDVLQCYHITPGSVVTLSLFRFLKLFSKHRFTYLKLDENDGIKNFKFRGLRGRVLSSLVSKIDMISIESRVLFNYVNQSNIFGRKVVYIPNGFYTQSMSAVEYEHKEDLIITVGRIGTAVKANEILLEAFRMFAAQNSSWKLKVIGPIEESFMAEIDSYFVNYPQLRHRVEFTGAITDRHKLQELYASAKIFVLTSKWEGFPLVFLEAMAAGCTIVSTAISPAYDVTADEKYGRLFPVGDAGALNKILVSLTDDVSYLNTNSQAIQKFAYQGFHWKTIVGLIDSNIRKAIH